MAAISFSTLFLRNPCAFAKSGHDEITKTRKISIPMALRCPKFPVLVCPSPVIADKRVVPMNSFHNSGFTSDDYSNFTNEKSLSYLALALSRRSDLVIFYLTTDAEGALAKKIEELKELKMNAIVVSPKSFPVAPEFVTLAASVLNRTIILVGSECMNYLSELQVIPNTVFIFSKPIKEVPEGFLYWRVKDASNIYMEVIKIIRCMDPSEGESVLKENKPILLRIPEIIT